MMLYLKKIDSHYLYFYAFNLIKSPSLKLFESSF